MLSFRVGEGSKTALLGANGAGKTTVLRMVAGDLKPQVGTISSAGGLGVMRQFMGSADGVRTVRDLLISVSPTSLRRAARALDATEARLNEAAMTAPGRRTRRQSPTTPMPADTTPSPCGRSAPTPRSARTMRSRRRGPSTS